MFLPEPFLLHSGIIPLQLSLILLAKWYSWEGSYKSQGTRRGTRTFCFCYLLWRCIQSLVHGEAFLGAVDSTTVLTTVIIQTPWEPDHDVCSSSVLSKIHLINTWRCCLRRSLFLKIFFHLWKYYLLSGLFYIHPHTLRSQRSKNQEFKAILSHLASLRSAVWEAMWLMSKRTAKNISNCTCICFYVCVHRPGDSPRNPFSLSTGWVRRCKRVFSLSGKWLYLLCHLTLFFLFFFSSVSVNWGKFGQGCTPNIWENSDYVLLEFYIVSFMIINMVNSPNLIWV